MSIAEKIKYWFELAEYDFITTKSMQDSKRFLYVGFMCHQTIEKVLKAYIVKETNENPPYIHNLTKLAKKSDLYKDFSEFQKDIIDILEPLNIEARYPTYKESLIKSLTEQKSNDILTKTGELFIWIKEKLEIK